MTHAAAKGQLEPSFQWVFVLLAGGAFLALFFVLAKGCAEQGEERLRGIGVLAAAEKIAAAEWRPEGTVNVTVRSADVSCVGGVITLDSDGQRASIERIPAFLPPRLSGKIRLATVPLGISSQGSPEIPLGSVVYALDERTYYLTVRDTTGGVEALEGFKANIVPVDVVSLSAPGTLAGMAPANAVIVIVSDSEEGYVANAAVQDIPAATPVFGVHVAGGIASFYERRNGRMEKVRSGPAEHELLEVGAFIAGRPEVYGCAREHLTERSRTLTRLYEERARTLSSELVVGGCAASLSTAAERLSAINSDPSYLAALFSTQRELSSLQSSLLARSCPVIA